jgi:hypothetical protein
MSVKLLYTNGDSWTYGEELGDSNDPNEQSYKFYNSWPWHIKENYNIPQLINDARGGGSNDRIFRRTTDFIRSMKCKPEECVIVVAWSSAERTEFGFLAQQHPSIGEDLWDERQFFNWHVGADPKDWSINPKGIRSPEDENMRVLWKSYTMLKHPIVDQPHLSMLMYSLQEICKSKGIKLYQFQGLTNAEFDPTSADFDSKLTKDIKYYTPAFNSLPALLGEDGESQIHREPNDHPTPHGHKLIADFVISNIGETI